MWDLFTIKEIQFLGGLGLIILGTYGVLNPESESSVIGGGVLIVVGFLAISLLIKKEKQLIIQDDL